MLIGDAAHPFLPYTGQGGNQAIEDAAVLAICLQLSGKKNVPLALRVAEKLRCVPFVYVHLRALGSNMPYL